MYDLEPRILKQILKENGMRNKDSTICLSCVEFHYSTKMMLKQKEANIIDLL